jgi:hypothetical protein
MNKFIRLLSNGLIIFYLVVIYFSGVPESNTLNSRLKKKTTDIAFILGIWPSWSMFAPNPIKFDSKTYIEITYRNGKTILKDIEEEPSGILAPFRKARWMKYSQDNLRNPKQKGLLAPSLRYHFAKFNSLDNPIVGLKIIRKWWDVPAFNEATPLIPINSNYKRNESQEILISEKYES